MKKIKTNWFCFNVKGVKMEEDIELAEILDENWLLMGIEPAYYRKATEAISILFLLDNLPKIVGKIAIWKVDTWEELTIEN
jgi:hypothetical protein